MLITTGGCETIKFVKIFTFLVYKLFFQKLQILRYLYFYWVFINFFMLLPYKHRWIPQRKRTFSVSHKNIYRERKVYYKDDLMNYIFFCFSLFVQFVEVLLIFLIDQKSFWVGKFNQKCESKETASLSNNHYFIYEN